MDIHYLFMCLGAPYNTVHSLQQITKQSKQNPGNQRYKCLLLCIEIEEHFNLLYIIRKLNILHIIIVLYIVQFYKNLYAVMASSTGWCMYYRVYCFQDLKNFKNPRNSGTQNIHS